jgi:hypothetical protein
LLPGKSTSAGGPRPAVSAFALKKDKEQQIIDLLRSSPITETRLNFISNLKHPVAGVHFLCILEDILE